MLPTNRKHEYHAEAKILHGDLNLPLVQKIKPQADAQLLPGGGYLAQHAKDFKLEAVISYKSAHTQVAGNEDPKDDADHGWATLSTTSIEGLNILDVLTADRVVGQIITDHPIVGYVPRVSFLGTRFENLRIAGHPVKLDLNHGILGDRLGEIPYSFDAGVKTSVRKQYQNILKQKKLTPELRTTYNTFDSALGSRTGFECSLVDQASGDYPGLTFGHIIHIPHFGKITLAKLGVLHEDFKKDDKGKETDVPKRTTITLTMLDLELGCAISGHAGVGTGSSNGDSRP